MRFTLDTNCLIDVEENRPDAPFIRELVSYHQKSINVAVSAIGASERKRNGGYAESFSEFQQKLKVIGFDNIELLLPIAYMDISFWDYGVFADETDTLEQEIHNVLFPNIEFSWVNYANARNLVVDQLDKKWRNAKCDVLTLWCHIKHGGGVFVTNDHNFHAITKQKQLKLLGAGLIAYPKDSLKLIKN